MLHMITAPESPLLSDTEGPAAQVLNAPRTGRALLVCEHATPFIPAALDGLGLTPDAAASHAAWDIGAMDVATELSIALDAPLVHSRVSRLVYDCNRPPQAADAIPARSERFDIPGNADLNEDQRAVRIRDIYAPFRHLLADTIAARPAPPVLITIHSFTPVYNGQHRAVELGILHDDDDRAAQVLLRKAAGCGLNVALNEPYSARDGVTHTLREHGTENGLQNVMIEIRNDLIDSAQGVRRIAKLLAPMLRDTVAELTGERA